MSKKLYSDIEQIIKKSVETNEPVFDEQAWRKMEALLDKDRDDRKPLFFWLWWLLPLLIVGGAGSYFFFSNSENKKETVTTTNEIDNIESKKIVEKSLSEFNKEKTVGEFNNVKPDHKNTISENLVKSVDLNKKDNPVKGSVNKNLTAVVGKEEFYSKNKNNGKTKAKTVVKLGISSPVADEEKEMVSKNQDYISTTKVNLTDSMKENDIVVIIDKDLPKEVLKKLTDSIVEKLTKEKPSKKSQPKLYFIVAAGAEASGMKLFSADKITARVGLGIGYQFNKNLSLQTGFYRSNKKYIAGTKDYKTKPGTYWNIVDIKKIDANCSVFEIPLLFRYDFNPAKKSHFYATGGLSSYIMKKENYVIYYSRYGVPYEAKVNYKNNKHLFSVLRLGAGIERQITPKFAVNLSPGFAIPLSGVGEGEVKLYSMDLQLGIKYSPWQKK